MRQKQPSNSTSSHCTLLLSSNNMVDHGPQNLPFLGFPSSFHLSYQSWFQKSISKTTSNSTENKRNHVEINSLKILLLSSNIQTPWKWKGIFHKVITIFKIPINFKWKTQMPNNSFWLYFPTNFPMFIFHHSKWKFQKIAVKPQVHNPLINLLYTIHMQNFPLQIFSFPLI